MWFLDANILVYAFRSDMQAQHLPVRNWLERALAGNRPIALHFIVELAFLRVATMSFEKAPAPSLDDAFAFIDALHRQPRYRPVLTGPAHEALFRQLCRESGLQGRHLTDVWLAALAIELKATMVSADSGFRRFVGLDFFDPLQDGGEG